MLKDNIFILLVLGVIVLSAVSCRPKNVLSSADLQDVLYDLHRTEGVLQEMGYTFGHDDEVNASFSVILGEHGITQAQFDTTLAWYVAHPRIFKHIYPKVVKRLQDDLDAINMERETSALLPVQSVTKLQATVWTRKRINTFVRGWRTATWSNDNHTPYVWASESF